MNDEFQRKTAEDLNYLRGKFDAIIPEMQKTSEATNAILLMHKEKIDRLEQGQAVIHTKVGIFGSLAGFVGGAIVAICVAIIQHYLPSK